MKRSAARQSSFAGKAAQGPEGSRLQLVVSSVFLGLWILFLAVTAFTA